MKRRSFGRDAGGHAPVAFAIGLALALLLPQHAVAEEEEAGLSAGTGGIVWRSPDEEIRFQLGGRLHLDAGRGVMREPDGGRTVLARGIVRRAWLEFGAVFHRDLYFDAQIAFEDRKPQINDLVVGYTGFDNLSIVAGNFQEPFSMEQVASSNDIFFPERSMAGALAPSRSLGAAVNLNGENWALSAGVFGGDINRRADREGIAVTARATIAPIYEDDRVLHLGASASHRERNRARDFDISTAPESSVFDETLLDIDTLERVRSLTRLGLEAAYIAGPFRLQGEYILAQSRGGRNGDGDPVGTRSFHGGYVVASYVLTGQSQSYSLVPDARRRDIGYGSFAGVSLSDSDRVSKSGFGAWEVAARYSFLDLNSGPIKGGVAQSASVALNWRPEPNLRLMSSYTRAFARGIGEDRERRRADVLQFRLQVSF